MEARLAVLTATSEMPSPTLQESAGVVVREPAPEETAPSIWPDDSVESAFRAEARERGEPMVATLPKEDTAEPAESTALPALNDLVARVPSEVREVLDELFRAKFVAVKRVPRKSLKT